MKIATCGSKMRKARSSALSAAVSNGKINYKLSTWPSPLHAVQMIMPYLLHFKHSGALKPANCNSVNRPVPLQSGHCMDPKPPQSLHVGIMCDLPAHMLCSNDGLLAALMAIDCHDALNRYFLAPPLRMRVSYDSPCPWQLGQSILGPPWHSEQYDSSESGATMRPLPSHEGHSIVPAPMHLEQIDISLPHFCVYLMNHFFP
jgi:hypothetical protein